MKNRTAQERTRLRHLGEKINESTTKMEKLSNGRDALLGPANLDHLEKLI